MRTLTSKVVNKTVTNTLHGKNFQSSKLVERSAHLYLPLFQLVSIPASIATTGIRSDAPYEHAGGLLGWNIDK